MSIILFHLKPLWMRVKSIFTRISPNGHMWLPGAGTNNGFDPRNYLDSAGTTVATVDGPCGLALDAAISGAGAINASQATPGAKPIERRGIVNLLTWSNDLTNAAWTKVGGGGGSAPTITNNFAVSPEGTNTATRVVFNLAGAGSASYVQQTLTGAATGVARTNGIWIKSNTGASGVIQFGDGSVGHDTIPVTTEWALVKYTASTNGQRATLIANSGIATITDVLVAGIGLFQGTLTAQQILNYGGIPLTTTAPASSTLGPQYWAFDGTDDRLTPSAVPFQMADNHCVVVAVKPMSVADRAAFAIRSSTLTAPIIAMIRFAATGKIEAFWRDDLLTVKTLISVSNYVVGDNYIVTAMRVGGTVFLRINGVLITSGAYISSTTTVDNASIGAVVTTVPSQWWLGNIYDVQAHKGTFTDTEIATMETYAARCAGGRLVGGSFVSDF